MKFHVKMEKTDLATIPKEKLPENGCHSKRHVIEFGILITLMFAAFILLAKCTATKEFLFNKVFNTSFFMSIAPTREKPYVDYLYNGPFDQFLQDDIGEVQDLVHSFSISEDTLKSTLNKMRPTSLKEVDPRIFTRLWGNEQCNILPVDHRFDCYPEDGVTEDKCVSRGCCWQKVNTKKKSFSKTSVPLDVPYCYYPTDYPGYYVSSKKNMPNSGSSIVLERNTSSYYPNDIMQLKFEVTYETSYRLRVKISDNSRPRWEVPFERPAVQHRNNMDDNLYTVTTPDKTQRFGFTVTRKSSGVTLLKTAGSLLFADQFLQLSYYLPSVNIYGLGEHRDSLMHSVNWTRFTLWNKDMPPTEKSNLYGSHPFYLMMEDDGNSHGVLLLNSNAMDVILQPVPAITWRTIGGVLDFYIFLGPGPADVVQQYTEVVGRSFMPPYWSLGFHLCRWGYRTAMGTLDVVNKVRNAGIPQDTQWNDIDYMDNHLDFTTSPQFGDQAVLVNVLHARGMHYMIIVDPGISNTQKAGSYHPYDLGMKLGIFINDSNNNPLVGVVWPGKTVFPDFTSLAAQEYWTIVVKNFHNQVAVDGLWIDMNEVSNFVDGSVNGCPHDNIENPPYLPAVQGGSLRYRTICVSARQKWSISYNVHNLYGLTETNASYQALKAARPGKRPFVISRSTFSGQGHYGGHWTGDNDATFYDMYKSISEILRMNMFGISMIGADICGFRDNTTEELCERWHQLGAFYPFSRNHNDRSRRAQDPASLGPAVAASTRKVYLTRYSLLPYLYTLVHKSHMMGFTVVRPLFFEFPMDKQTYRVDRQFIWGSALLISPVLEKGVLEVEAYFPAKSSWYDFYSGRKITDHGGVVRLDAPLDVINLSLRAGYILPMQKPALTTTDARKNNFWLLVALNATGGAEGDLFWDDGDTIDSHAKGLFNMLKFHTSQKMVSIDQKHIGLKDERMVLSNVTVFGLDTQPNKVTINGKETSFTFNTGNKVLYVVEFNAKMLQPFKLVWS
ncbi:lysosomal alpha-glucosidase-like [Gigantopelta aegis]|uniref:lysosomal alpha-glucosidase-like n=1 Tax=Gigantopelta aegis TaxID=1735272 RepID=UPI001B8879BB|nr:lysosomal alpha-glucosidase-like [Gigantopelta aegis]